MNLLLVIENVEKKKSAVLRTLLDAKGKPISLTGISMMSDVHDKEVVSQILAWASLSGHVQIRQVNDSINGEVTLYHTTNAQRQRIALLLREYVDDKEQVLEKSVKIDQEIYAALINSEPDVGLGIEQLAKQINYSKRQVQWRALHLTRVERISRTKDERYFLTDEQRIMAVLNQPEIDLEFSQEEESLNKAINVLLEESKKQRARRNELKGELRNALRNIRDKQNEIKRIEQKLSLAKEELKRAKVTREDLEKTMGHEIAQVQGCSMSLAEKLSFLRKLQMRPALSGYALLEECIKDYEIALALQRHRE